VTTGAVIALMLLAACTPTEPAEGAMLNADGDALYTDGTYLVSYSHTGTDGWQPFLQLRVRAGLVTRVCFAATKADGTLVRDDEAYVERFRLETGADLVSLLDRLEAGLIARQQLPLELPVVRIDGRLWWANSFVVLAEASLNLARVGDVGATVVPAVGPYVGHDRPDELGWEARMVIIFGDTGVVAAHFEERRVGADGTVMVKADDPVSTEAYERVLELSPAGVATELSRQFVQGGMSETDGEIVLDGITGATGTTDRFQILAERVLTVRISVPLPSKFCTE
jgi:major membrane immunogen (membrane-anchored lipoprotein)